MLKPDSKLAKHYSRKQNKQFRYRQLHCEPLEARQLLACLITGPDKSKVLNIACSDKPDHVRLAVVGTSTLRIDHKSAGEAWQSKSVARSAVDIIRFTGGAGNDVLSNSYGNLAGNANPLPAIFADGGTGSDEIHGGGRDDVLYGGAGNYRDTIYGRAGSDEIHGGAGNDLLDGGPGNGRIFGEEGDFDNLYGQTGRDFLDAGSALASEQIRVGYGSEPDFIAYRPAHAQADDDSAVSFEDLIQNQSVGNCSLLAAIGAVANSRAVDLAGRIDYLGQAQYRVRLYDPATGTLRGYKVTFDGRTTPQDPIIKNGHKEFWPILYKRAFDQILTNASDERVTASEALRALLGRGTMTVTQSAFSLSGLIAALASNKPVVYSTFLSNSPYLVDGHSYTVLRVTKDRRIVLYNPWGEDGGLKRSGVADEGQITVTFEEFKASGLRYYIGS